jgi:hypothetical protein
MQHINLKSNDTKKGVEFMKTILSKKTWFIIIAVVVTAVVISLFVMQSTYGRTNYSSQLQNSFNNSVNSVITPPAIVIASQILKPSSSSQISSTSITVDVTQSKAAYTISKAKSSSNNTTSSNILSVSSKVTSSKINVSSKVSSVISSSAPSFPPVPASQECVTKKVGNNTILLNVNAFTFEAFVDWSSVQEYLLDDFYVKVYKNGVLKDGPTLYGCVAKEPTNTVAIEIDTYESNGHWYIDPATYTIECYCELGEHSLITENRPNIIPCPSASFSVAINERGFQ